MHKHESWLPVIDRLADTATQAILPRFRTPMDVVNKDEADFDPVTVADREAEVAMRAIIAVEHPDHGILGEELENVGLDSEYVWVLDPIDGTRSFISGLPTWGTLIGLTRNGRAVAGMMAQPFTGERFYGGAEGARYTGPGGPRTLRTRPCARLADASLFTTTPRIFTPEELALYQRVEARSRMPRYGTDCYAYAMVAAGHADIVVEAGLKAFDVVALIPLVEAAGGIFTSWTGGPATDGGRVVASGDPRVHEEALRLLAQAG